MNCLKCGTSFSNEDALMIQADGTDPICDSCDLSGEVYLITYGEKEFVVQAYCSNEALRSWEKYVQWMELAIPNERPNIRKIEHFVPID